MYRIIKNGEEIAITEKLNFIRQTTAGVFVSCTEREAQGVAVKNTAYNLVGREAMANCETVAIIEVDGGAHIQTGETSQTEADALIVDHEYRLTLLEMGVTE